MFPADEKMIKLMIFMNMFLRWCVWIQSMVRTADWIPKQEKQIWN